MNERDPKVVGVATDPGFIQAGERQLLRQRAAQFCTDYDPSELEAELERAAKDIDDEIAALTEAAAVRRETLNLEFRA